LDKNEFKALFDKLIIHGDVPNTDSIIMSSCKYKTFTVAFIVAVAVLLSFKLLPLTVYKW
jgi:hypothetical protein